MISVGVLALVSDRSSLATGPRIVLPRGSPRSVPHQQDRDIVCVEYPMKTLITVGIILGVATIAGSAVVFDNNRLLTKTASTSSCTLAMISPIEFAKSEIASNDVVVFSKTFCPHCTSTKKLFSDMSVSAKIIELDKLDNGADVQSALLDITGQRTVPNVFIKGTHLGGNDVTQAAAKNGKLMEMMGK